MCLGRLTSKKEEAGPASRCVKQSAHSTVEGQVEVAFEPSSEEGEEELRGEQQHSLGKEEALCQQEG